MLEVFLAQLTMLSPIAVVVVAEATIAANVAFVPLLLLLLLLHFDDCSCDCCCINVASFHEAAAAQQ